MSYDFKKISETEKIDGLLENTNFLVERDGKIMRSGINSSGVAMTFDPSKIEYKELLKIVGEDGVEIQYEDGWGEIVVESVTVDQYLEAIKKATLLKITIDGVEWLLPKCDEDSFGDWGYEKFPYVVEIYDYDNELWLAVDDNGEDKIISVKNCVMLQKVLKAETKITSYYLNESLGSENLVSTAAGLYSHAEGIDNNASGWYSHCEGQYNNASGDNSHCEGRDNNASGDNSHCEGRDNNASGDNSHCEGQENIAHGDTSHVEGKGNLAHYLCSHVEGTNNFAWYGGHAEGTFSSSIGVGAHASGARTCAIGWYSHTEGGSLNKKSSSIWSIDKVEGNRIWIYNDRFTTTLVPGKSSIGIFGVPFMVAAQNKSEHYVDLICDYNIFENVEELVSVAEGETNIIVNSNYCNYAIGDFSHTEGIAMRAEGVASHAEGEGTIASGDAQHAQGKYNIPSNTHAFVIGNGTSDANRSNAHYVEWDGNAFYAGQVECNGVVLKSPNGTKHVVTVSDDGVLIVTKKG